MAETEGRGACTAAGSLRARDARPADGPRAQGRSFRQDTDAGHRDGSWFAAFVERLGLHGEIHLRGVHYAARDEEELHEPDGTPYLGTDEE